MVYSWSFEQTDYLYRNYHRVSSKELEGYTLFDNKTDDAIRQKACRMGLKRGKRPEVLDELDSLRRQNAEMESVLDSMRAVVDRVGDVERQVGELAVLNDSLRDLSEQVKQVQDQISNVKPDDRLANEVKGLADRLNNVERQIESIERMASPSYF